MAIKTVLQIIVLVSISSSADAQEWCDTHKVWTERAKALGGSKIIGTCPTQGICDFPECRDNHIPNSATPFKSIRLHFVILREYNGDNPAATEADIAFQLAQLNADYAPQHIQFVGGYDYMYSTPFRYPANNADVDAMKFEYSGDPEHGCNVFITDLSGISPGLRGRGTYPWEPVAVLELGGVIVDDDHFGAPDQTLTHEIGHNLGLYHTHRGVSEVCVDELNNCIACPEDIVGVGACPCTCYERADGVDGDTTGDFCFDTRPTPLNRYCPEPGGLDACSSTPWAPTQPENYLSYAEINDSTCWNMFTPQQAGRMHCWITSTFLRGWMTGKWGDEVKITPSDSAVLDGFGWGVSFSGDTAVVGAPWAGNNGSAYIFIRSGGARTQQQKLTASDGAAHDIFGFSVSISGDTAVVGAPGASKYGAAYVFRRSGGAWTQQQKLTASVSVPSSSFGFSVSISGDTAVVGAPDDWEVTGDAGWAYVFVRNGGTWTQQAKMTALGGARYCFFGQAVSISGDAAVVGARNDNANGITAGSAYVFVRSGGVWNHQAKLTASDGAVGDSFGRSVSISGDTAVVGANEENNAGGVNAGSAYVFVRIGGAWIQQQKLTASDGASYDLFGRSVSISGDTAVVGAEQADNAGGSDAGSGYIFRRSGGTWTQQAKLTASVGTTNGQFGKSVSMSGDMAVIGASGDKGLAGSAYFYRLLPRSPGDVTGNGVVNVDDLLAVITAWGPCSTCLCDPDVTHDGTTNVDDLLGVINNWG